MDAFVVPEKHLWERTLNAAIIYDDLDFAARTAALLERAAIRSDEFVQWDVKPWRLDLLKPSSLADAALAETAGVDLMVIALVKTHVLPDTLLDWLEDWAERREVRDAGVMVLCPEETAGPRSSWEQLKEFAELRRLLFLGSRRLSDEGTSLDLVQQLWRRKQMVLPTLAWSAHAANPPRHWGLNE